MNETAGSVLIRPTRAQALKDTNAFYDLLQEFRGRGGLTLEDLASVTDDQTVHKAQTQNKRIGRKSHTLQERSSILSYIFDAGRLLFGRKRAAVRAVPDAPYFALLELFGVDDEKQDEARAVSVGTYRFWRHSAEHPGEYVLGQMRIEEAQDSAALKVVVRQAKQSRQGVRASEDVFSGYMFALPTMYFILLRNDKTNDQRTILLPVYKLDYVGTDINAHSVFNGRNFHLTNLEGFSSGLDGSKSFQSAVHIELVDDVRELAKLEGEIDVVSRNDGRLPERVAQMLDRNGVPRSLVPVPRINR